MRTDAQVRGWRDDAGLTLREVAESAGLATSTVHRIERGDLVPTVATLERIAAAVGARLVVDAEVDPSSGVVGLARAIRVSEEGRVRQGGDLATPVRLAAELVARFDAARDQARERMIGVEPPPTWDQRWDAFLGGIAEWLAVRAGMEVPTWTRAPERYLDHGWWVTDMVSMRAWEYAGAPVSLQRRGVYLHRESLINV